MKLKTFGKKILILGLAALSFFSCKGAGTEPAPSKGNDKEWRIRCLVLSSEKVSAMYGGNTEQQLKDVEAMLSGASSRFKTKNINNGEGIVFAVTEVKTFSGSPASQMSTDGDPSAYDLKIVLSAETGEEAHGFFGSPFPTIGHNKGVLFDDEALDDLAKLLGLSRGAVDLAAETVRSSEDNPINGTVYHSPSCIMNNPAGLRRWSDYAAAIINNAGKQGIAPGHETYFPSSLVFKAVIGESGNPIPGVVVNFYPVRNGKVEQVAVMTGKTGEDGIFRPQNNPFIQKDKWLGNLLVEFSFHGNSKYSWLPLHELEQKGLEGATEYAATGTYTQEEYELTLGIPDDDYVNRALEFEKLRGWPLRCKVMAEAQTVADNGGRISFMRKMDALLEECSSRFWQDGFDDSLHFYMVSMTEFTGQSKTYMYDRTGSSDSSYDMRIVVNGHAGAGDVSGGWLGSPYLCIGHDFTSGGKAILWEGWGLDALVHEMGHSRGIHDLYAEQVNDPAKNPINGQTYKSLDDMMNYPYGNTKWCDFDKAVINRSAGRKECIGMGTYIPKQFKARLVGKDGKEVVGARFTFYPVKAYSYTVSETPFCEGVSGDTGYYNLPSNPFITGGTDTYNLLVKCTWQGSTTYGWWPIHEASYDGILGKDTATFTIKL